MEYEVYKQKYENEVINLWNKCLTFDAITPDKFRKQAILDENFDEELSQVAIHNNKIVGFAYATKRKFAYLERGLEENRGWINVIFVDPEYQRQGIGTNLLKYCEKKLEGREITVAAYSPNYFFWGIDKYNYKSAINFFEKHGYIDDSEHYSMGRNLHGYTIPEVIQEKKIQAEKLGYRFMHFDYSYTLDLLNFLRDEFGGGWKRNALIAMQNKTAEDVLMLVVDKDNKICGCCNRAIDGNPSRFGPIGIAKDKRDAGLGTILLDCVLQDMAQKGIYRVFFVTTDEPGKRYYSRQGFEVIRTCVEYRRPQ